MHATAVLQKLLRRSIPSVHLKRLNSLVAMVASALSGGRLTLSALGRSLPGTSAVRHRIKRVDRLLGNRHLQQERLLFYRVLCDLLIGAQPQPILIVDWSDLTKDRSLLLLRASVWVHGFALPIYEEIHPLRLQSNRRIQRDFLLTLRMLLAETACPIMVTDAGFRSTWFQEVERLGWHWVGRIRGQTMILIDGRWRHCKKLYPQATAVARDLGELEVTRDNRLRARLALYRKTPKGRHHFTLAGEVRCSKLSRKNAARESEPWLIAASPSLRDKTALDLINLYRVRMRIEHSFRTLKSHQFGFAFEDSQTRTSERIAALLLIHAFALFLAWIAGWAAQRSGLQQYLCSNTNQTASLSVISLGWMALTILRLKLSPRDFNTVLGMLGPPPSQIIRQI